MTKKRKVDKKEYSADDSIALFQKRVSEEAGESIAERVNNFLVLHKDNKDFWYPISLIELLQSIGATYERYQKFSNDNYPEFLPPSCRFVFSDESSLICLEKYTGRSDVYLGFGSFCWCLKRHGHKENCVAYFSEIQKKVDDEIQRLGLEVQVLTVTSGTVALEWGDRRQIFHPDTLLLISRQIHSSCKTATWWDLMVENCLR